MAELLITAFYYVGNIVIGTAIAVLLFLGVLWLLRRP